MKLRGIEITQFRNIDSKGISLNPWSRCNVLVGQNNSGKSNVIRALQKVANVFEHQQLGRQSHYAQGAEEITITDLDVHMQDLSNSFRFTLVFYPESEEEYEIVNLLESEYLFFTFQWSKNALPQIENFTFLEYTEDFHTSNELSRLTRNKHWSSRVRPDQINSAFVEDADNIFRKIALFDMPKVYHLPEFRQIQRGDEYEFRGTNLIEELSSFQHPIPGEDHERQKFRKIEQFIRRLLHLPDAELEVTHDKSTIMLSSNGLRLPLGSYGTGVHELIILITAVLSVEESIICVEEPEIHLHPKLQREFIQFLVDETTNDYVISTHSPTFINARSAMAPRISDDIQVHHLTSSRGKSRGTMILRDDESLSALDDLGVKASDLLQSNCVMWVEGPSDRVYLSYYLNLLAPDLIEGLHYSIMFYGGKLLSHLNADRQEVPGQLIRLLRINQNAIVIIDSDKEQEDDRISATKRRIERECRDSDSFCWITDGREIENYLSTDIIIEAIQDRYGVKLDMDFGWFDRLETVLDSAVSQTEIEIPWYTSDKVGFADLFTTYITYNDVAPELEEKLNGVISMLNAVNS